MERHALLHRIQHSRQLSRRMASRPSLLTYVTGHNPLPPALNPQSSDSAKLPASQPYIAKFARQSQPEPLEQQKQQYDTPEATAQHISFEAESPATLQDDAEHTSVPTSDQAVEQTSRKDTFHSAGTYHSVNTTQKQQQTSNTHAKPATHTNKAAAHHAQNERNVVGKKEAHDNGRPQESTPPMMVFDNGRPQGFPPTTIENNGRPQGSPPTTTFEDGRPQGSPPTTTPPPPLPYDAPPANLRFASHNTASDDGRADIVGAGVAEDEGRGPLRSPVLPPPDDEGRGPLRSPVLPPPDTEGHEPSRSPILSQHEDGEPEPSRSPVLPQHEDEGREQQASVKPVEVHQARPRRGRIEERPASTMSTDPVNPTTSTPQKPNIANRPKGTGQPNLSSQHNQPGKTGHQEQPQSPKSQAQIEADALFQPKDDNASRTPQQWLAMLLNAGRHEPSKPESSPKPAPRDEAPEYSRGEGGEDVGRGALAVARSSHNEDAGRGALAVARSSHNEDVGRENAVAQRPQSDESAPNKHLPAARPLSRTTTQTENAQAEPLSQQTRQFLRPLVGYDPAKARVHRGVPAARFAASHNAQAVTSGDDIALAAGHQSDTPETLGLLAHELTHVARQHTPGFVPPVAENSRTDEEGVAEQVEQHAVRQARRQGEKSGNSSQWGGLPAPWEPLPDWLTSSSTTAEARGRGSDIDGHRTMQPATTDLDARSVHMPNTSNGNGHAAHLSNMPTAMSGTKASGSNGNNGHSSNGGNGGSVQRAGNERSLNITAQEVNEPSQGSQQNDTVQEPEPDLDELARQVYTVLKRRLGVERRRMG